MNKSTIFLGGVLIGTTLALGVHAYQPTPQTWDGTVPEGNQVHLRSYAPENFKEGDAWVDNVGDGVYHKYYRFDGKTWHEVKLVDGLTPKDSVVREQPTIDQLWLEWMWENL